LLLKSPGAGDHDTQSYFREQFEKCGLTSDRVDFHGEALPLREHLQLYRECDVALDPFPYNGTTTTCEALLMGVPVVTLAGNAHVSRVGVSFLQSVGLGDLVAKDLEEYCEIAARLAANAARRKELRATLRERLLTGPLGNAETFTQNFESALIEVSKR
jgi:predicted O-linked N-acetylglucosamine transferase (SPINDLY family)